ncbi:hypothetical protein ACO1O0_006170 [Amphichorda felina]
MARPRRIFRVLYTSIYFFLYAILLGLLLITPGDAIKRSIRNRQTYNIWLLIICYVATIVLLCFIYVVRLYINKRVLAAIPKSWLPIEIGDVSKPVHKMIAAGLDRSAAVAYEARPRVEEPGQQRVTPAAAEGLGISESLQHAIWDGIEHKGWASPSSPDMPNLQYTTVLSELPNLIEAKAMTLAPPDPTAQTEPPSLDTEAVALLQRPANLSLRGYMEHLTSLGVLAGDEVTTDFLQQYEYARFSTRPISNAQFRELMHLFAGVLRSMEPLDLEALDEEMLPSESGFGHHSDDGDDINPSTPRSHLSRTATTSTQNSVRRPQPRSSSWGNYRTAPSTPHSWRALTPKSSSSNSFAQSRHPYQPASGSSSASSLRSGGSSSVIRLATHEDDVELPYVLNLRGTADTTILGG